MMAEATSTDDRLPWLDPARPVKLAKLAKPRPAAPSVRTPLLILLGLFLGLAIAMMAYYAGRGTAPLVVPATTVSRPVAPAPVPRPVEAPPALPPAPAPAVAAAQPAAVPLQAAATRPRATRPKTKRKASAHRRVTRSHGVTVHRDIRRARNIPRHYDWPVTSTAGPSGRVIQLGAYVSGRQTMASWRRLRRAYPYLATLPRKVTVVRPRAARARYYRLRIGAPSPGHARAICDELHRIGRGCIVV